VSDDASCARSAYERQHLRDLDRTVCGELEGTDVRNRWRQQHRE
jgi:hypothetical protein